MDGLSVGEDLVAREVDTNTAELTDRRLALGAVALAAAAALAAELPFLIVRKDAKAYGTGRRIEGVYAEGATVCLVEDVVTTGGSTVRAIERIREEGLEIAGIVCVLDRLGRGAEAIRAVADGAPYRALTTIDDVYPERPDR